MANDFARKNFLGFNDFIFNGKAVEGCTRNPLCFLSYKKAIVLSIIPYHNSVSNNADMKVDLGPRGSEIFKMWLEEAANLKVRKSNDGWEYKVWNEESGEDEWVGRWKREWQMMFRNRDTGADSPTGKYLVVTRGKDGVIKFGLRHFAKKFPFIPFAFTSDGSQGKGIGQTDAELSAAEESALHTIATLRIWDRFDLYNTFRELPQYETAEEAKRKAKMGDRPSYGAPLVPQRESAPQQQSQGQSSWGTPNDDEDAW